jgi:hypothetical protein
MYRKKEKAGNLKPIANRWKKEEQQLIAAF